MVVDLAARSRAMPVERRAVIAILVAVVLWSGTSLFVRAGHSDALVFTTWRLWFALPPLLAVVAWRSGRTDSAPFWPEDVPRLRWLALLLGAGAFFIAGAATTFAALGLTRLLDVTLIGSLQPILIIGFAVAFLGEHVARTHLIRAAVAIAGTIMVAAAASGSGTWSLWGDVLAVLSLIFNAGWFLYGRVLRTRIVVDPFAFMLGTLTAAALLLTPLTLVVHGSLSHERARVLLRGVRDGRRDRGARDDDLGAPPRADVGVVAHAARGDAVSGRGRVGVLRRVDHAVAGRRLGRGRGFVVGRDARARAGTRRARRPRPRATVLSGPRLDNRAGNEGLWAARGMDLAGMKLGAPVRLGPVRLAAIIATTTVGAVGLGTAPAYAASPQTITFGPLSNKLFGAAPFDVSATTTATQVEPPVAHGSSTNANNCVATFTPPIQQPTSTTLSIGMGADASPRPHFGQVITLTNTEITATVPADLLLLGYQLGFISDGQVFAASLQVTVAASNTAERTHAYAAVPATVTVHFVDPDGIPNNGDETAVPLDLTLSLPDTSWHPVDASAPVSFTEKSGSAQLVVTVFGTPVVAKQDCTAPGAVPFVDVDATSSLPVSFASLTSTVCTVAGSSVTVLAAGRCTIEATQAGNADWDPALPFEQSFVVGYTVSSLSPPPHGTFTPGSKLPVKFKLTGAGGSRIPTSVVANLGCTATVSFDGGAPVCAVWDPVTDFFRASVATPKNASVHGSYPVRVAVMADGLPVASASVSVSPAVVAQHIARSGYWMLASNGAVYAFGNAPKLGSAPGTGGCDRSAP